MSTDMTVTWLSLDCKMAHMFMSPSAVFLELMVNIERDAAAKKRANTSGVGKINNYCEDIYTGRPPYH